MTLNIEAAHHIGEILKAKNESVAVAESSTGGMISAALLAVPGASAYYQGGAVIYTLRARRELLGIDKDSLDQQEPLSESYVTLCAEKIRSRMKATWGVAELGATGPAGTPYGHGPGICALAVVGPISRVQIIQTNHGDRERNMEHFCNSALSLLKNQLQEND